MLHEYKFSVDFNKLCTYTTQQSLPKLGLLLFFKVYNIYIRIRLTLLFFIQTNLKIKKKKRVKINNISSSQPIVSVNQTTAMLGLDLIGGGDPHLDLLELGGPTGNGDPTRMVEPENPLGLFQKLTEERVVEIHHRNQIPLTLMLWLSHVDCQVALRNHRGVTSQLDVTWIAVN